MKKLLIMLLKVGVSAAIIGYLVYDVTRNKGHGENVFQNLLHQQKQWGLLAWAWAFCAAAAILTFIRWWLLIRALGIPCRFNDSIRISFWGYLFNLAPLGIVGGDVVKAVMLDHEHHGYRAKAIASVFADRIIGLYWLFVVASAAILLNGYWRTDEIALRQICTATFIITLASTLGLGVALGPDAAAGRIARAIGRIPRVGKPLESLIDAVRMYRNRPQVLIISSVMSVGVHCLFAAGCYLIARGLPAKNCLSLAQHFVVMPLSAAMQVIPVPFGPTEGALEFLYRHTPVVGPAIVDGQGLLIALTYRLIMLLIAALGIPYYLGNRREMTEVIHEAEQESPS